MAHFRWELLDVTLWDVRDDVVTLLLLCYSFNRTAFQLYFASLFVLYFASLFVTYIWTKVTSSGGGCKN